MTTNYDELRQAAETATPGPWRALERRWENDTDWLVIFSFRTDDEGLEIWDEDSSLPSQANAQFIALANPTTTLALLDENAALQAALTDAQWTHDPAGEYDWQFCPSCFGTEPRHQPDCGLAKALDDAS